MNDLKSSSDESFATVDPNYDFLSLSIKQQFEEYKKQKNNYNNNNDNEDDNESFSINKTSNNSNNNNSIYNNDDKINRTKLFSQIKELDKNSIMLIETYYRDKLITYQEKLKKELEFIYSKKLESLKDQYDKNSYLKLKELELWTKKSLLKLLIEFQDLKKQKQQQQQQQQQQYNIDNNNNNDDKNIDINIDINKNNLMIQKEEDNILNRLEGLTKCVSELLLHQNDLSDGTLALESFLNSLNSTIIN